MATDQSLIKVKKASDLPVWFKIEKYSAASMLNARGWYEQLFIRWFCYRIGLTETPIGILEQIQLKPIIEISDSDKFEVIMRFSTSKVHGKFNSDIHFLTPRELILHAGGGVTSKQLEYSLSYLTQNHLNEVLPYESFIDDPITCVSEATARDNITLSVNPNLPEQLLMSQFQALIKKMKSDHSPEKRYQKFDYQKWHAYGILPYIDLKMWGERNKKEITIRSLTDAIHPHGERSEEDMRKTTISTAETMLSDKELIKLAAQIDFEGEGV